MTRSISFDRIAPLYRWMEYLSFGKSLERCRNHFLPELADCGNALILGDGDGRFTARLLAAHTTLHAEAVDTSSTMLHLLQRRVEATVRSASTRLRIHRADALTFTPQGPCDLIVTHFFLDCLTQSQLDTLANRLARHASPHALWLVSDFRIPTGLMHWPARIIVRGLYIAFRVMTGLDTVALPDHIASLSSAGFHRKNRRLSLGGLLVTELWEYQPCHPALTEIKHNEAADLA
ncbi:MAG TPA: methyltransferase domain-containing protein [Acidobacteriaceae bacterium]|nr:methyltransferase domain-containing protein [Acidobacteriaceae bacterium]